MSKTIVYGIDPGARSRLNAVLMVGMFIGMAIGSALASLVLAQWGWTAVTLLAMGAALAALLVITVGGIGKNLVYYWGPSELQAAGDKAIGATIRLGGLVADGSIRRGGNKVRVAAHLTDAATQSDLQDRARTNTERFLRDTLGSAVLIKDNHIRLAGGVA